MGGHNAGEVASSMTAELIARSIQADASAQRLTSSCAEALVREYIDRANAAVFEAASANSEFHGMGTTLVVALLHESGVTYGHVGDSRLYRLRDGRLEQLTRDHSVVQQQLDLGVITPEQARTAINRNVLTRAVGIDPEVDADIETGSVAAGDVYLLCSDGLTDMVTDSTISATLVESGHVKTAAARLIELANAAGGHDNISVIVMQVVQERRGALS
jgi:protein phosphatase